MNALFAHGLTAAHLEADRHRNLGPVRELTPEERREAAINAVTHHPRYQELVLDVMHDRGEHPEDFL